ncbi:hypothetical protein HMPREF1624_08055 [Sporothrix schenckii ATCC 58251]|uniref:Peptidase A1 domain-containing protein n=1 Tax=Sporothrix schenckii (strain ATCC 58251 / de Perez 2211183) TaxID=1391915 RepID=U7PLD7_SPOS1|nr:hypothetical protein HMPREF1624_08055 [Sporothrix schenckii ATCC 58251]
MAVLSVLLGSLAAASVVAGAPASSSASSETPHYGSHHRSGNHVLVSRAPAVALAEHTLPLVRHVPGAQGRRARPRPWHNPDRAVWPLHATWHEAVAAGGSPNGSNATNGTSTSTSTTNSSSSTPPAAISSGLAPSANHDIEYLTSVVAGTNNLSLVVDTGSSDTWFVRQGFSCIDPQYHEPTLVAACRFGPEFKGDFPGGAIANQHLSVAYGSANGPFMQGVLGYADLTVAGLTTRNQTIGLGTRGFWDGDGISSGLLGLGLPGLTNALPGAVSTSRAGDLADQLRTPVEYSPLVATMASSSSGNNVTQFSLALSRDPQQSFLAFGGAPAHIAVDPALGWVTTPIVKTVMRSVSASGSASRQARYMYYTISIESLQYNSSLLRRSTLTMDQQPLRDVPIIVDSGTTLNLFSYDVALAINQLYTPRAQFDPDQGAWIVRCDATPPSLGVQIGDKTIWTDPKSMILPPPPGAGVGENLCLSGVGARSELPYILGDTFMQQLVTVFDVANKEIKFAKRLGTTAAAAPKSA